MAHLVKESQLSLAGCGQWQGVLHTLMKTPALIEWLVFGIHTSLAPPAALCVTQGQ